MKRVVFMLVVIVSFLVAFLSSCTELQGVLNKSPNWTKPSYTVSVTVGQEVVFDLSDKVSDPDGDPVTISILEKPTGVEASITSDKKFKFTPSSQGTYEFVLKASDNKGGESKAGIVVNVSVVPNNAPVWKNSKYTQTSQVGQTIQLDLSGEISDPEGDAIVLTLVGETYGAQITSAKVFVSNTTGRKTTWPLSILSQGN
ncbi:MAG: Ig-like domain-containing protein [Fervidobacterium sp.]